MTNQIINKIARAKQAYYHGNQPVMDDQAYDELLLEAKRLGINHPVVTAVGAPIPAHSQLTAVTHKHPMGSLSNVFNVTEAAAWWAGLQNRGAAGRVVASFKLDGCSVSLTYIGGELRSAATRGDGYVGEDITANAVLFQGVPSCATLYGKPFSGYVRGEVVLCKKAWLVLDPEGNSNPRNLGNGIARRKSGVDSSSLNFVAFRVFNSDGEPVASTEMGMRDIAIDLGFVFVRSQPCRDNDEVAAFYDLYNNPDAGLRESLTYEIDGLVLKLDSIPHQMRLGETSNCPVGQVAFKFTPRGGETVLEGIDITLGVTGKLTPVAKLAPVKVGGVTITSATLCNWDEIARLNVKIGDTVRVVRAADVIPKITMVVKSAIDGVPIMEPTVCPITGGTVGRIELLDGTLSSDLYSLDSKDSAPIAIQMIHRWLGLLGIDGLGPVYVNALFAAGLVKTPADLYTLRARGVTHLNSDTGTTLMGAATMKSVIHEIEAKRNVTLDTFIAGLGVRGLGRKQIVRSVIALPESNTVDFWIDGVSILKHTLAGITKPRATRLCKDLHEMAPLAQKLIEVGIAIVPVDTTPKVVAKFNFCITGDVPQGKPYWHQMILDAGYGFETSFNKRVTHVVTADTTRLTVKLKKASEAGLPVINTVELEQLITAK